MIAMRTEFFEQLLENGQKRTNYKQAVNIVLFTYDMSRLRFSILFRSLVREVSTLISLFMGSFLYSGSLTLPTLCSAPNEVMISNPDIKSFSGVVLNHRNNKRR